MNSRSKKILLISPFPPSQNPRLLKEYQALKNAGFQVKALYAERDLWSSNYEVPEGFERVGGKVGSLSHWVTRITHKLSKMILPHEYGYHRVSLLLLRKALKIKADLYIGHELTSLPIAVKAARKYKAKSGFDIEDCHRFESSNNLHDTVYKAAVAIENKFISELDYITCASPLIGQVYKKFYPKINPILINNVFNKQKANPNAENIDDINHQPLKLFWFSQTIGTNRGIETVIEALGMLTSKKVKLTLLGSISNERLNYFKDLATEFGLHNDQLEILDPVSPTEIFEVAKSNDIGLALEPAFSLNNDIALSNKIFTYLSVGLTIIASNTKAQQKFFEENPTAGFTHNIGDTKTLSTIIQRFIDDKVFLRQNKKNAIVLAQTRFNWELESQKFISIINSTL